MPVSRRSFLGAISPGTAAHSPAFIAARGREAFTAGGASAAPPSDAKILLDSNENPLGPGPAAMEALTRAFVDAGRYPTNARPSRTTCSACKYWRRSISSRPMQEHS